MKLFGVVWLILTVVDIRVAQFSFPLQIGNTWQYKEPPPPPEPYIYEDKIVSDTLMPNGHTYFSLRVAGGTEFHYYRKQGLFVYD